LKDPKEFVNSMNVIVMQDPKTTTDNIIMKKFDTKNPTEASQASQVMAAVLTSEMGATIVDDQPGKESILQNMNSDSSKTTSQIASGFSITNGQVQKMAPGDKMFHLVSWNDDKKTNFVKSYESREEADTAFNEKESENKLLVSGETGDVLLAAGSPNMIDQCVGYFYTQRYQGKYYG
jgi:hypothetical protein